MFYWHTPDGVGRRMKSLVSALTSSSDPPLNSMYNMQDDATVVASNQSPHNAEPPELAAAIAIATDQAISDTGATSIFIMEDLDVDNKRVAQNPLTINLPDGNTVQLTHQCEIIIPGLPTILMGHIVPHLAIASLIGIRLLSNAGCTITFDKLKCDVMYKGEVILRGVKDPSTNLWTLPIPRKRVGTTPGNTFLSQPGPSKGCAPHLSKHPALVCFAHSIRTQANAVKFAHQSLCNLTISTLLKATRRGFLKGCPNITKDLLINKYLNHSFNYLFAVDRRDGQGSQFDVIGGCRGCKKTDAKRPKSSAALPLWGANSPAKIFPISAP